MNKRIAIKKAKKAAALATQNGKMWYLFFNPVTKKYAPIQVKFVSRGDKRCIVEDNTGLKIDVHYAYLTLKYMKDLPSYRKNYWCACSHKGCIPTYNERNSK